MKFSSVSEIQSLRSYSYSSEWEFHRPLVGGIQLAKVEPDGVLLLL